MKKRIGNTNYDTDTADFIEHKYVGEFGQPDGYEERLFVTKKTKRHFIYGVGGPESEYSSETIKLLTDQQAEEWKKNIS